MLSIEWVLCQNPVADDADDRRYTPSLRYLVRVNKEDDVSAQNAVRPPYIYDDSAQNSGTKQV